MCDAASEQRGSIREWTGLRWWAIWFEQRARGRWYWRSDGEFGTPLPSCMEPAFQSVAEGECRDQRQIYCSRVRLHHLPELLRFGSSGSSSVRHGGCLQRQWHNFADGCSKIEIREPNPL